jgi:hypothetical protein
VLPIFQPRPFFQPGLRALWYSRNPVVVLCRQSNIVQKAFQENGVGLMRNLIAAAGAVLWAGIAAGIRAGRPAE